MKTLICVLLSLLGAGRFAFAQEQATTLDEACRRADVVVQATVIAATDPSPDWHRLRFRVDVRLAGTIGAEFDLLEPAGACCGRSLFALQTGAQCLLFLQRRGPTLHPFGGGRGVLPADPALLRHVQALLGASSPAEKTAVLAGALQDDLPRIRDDAALALACMPSLLLDAAGKRAVAEQIAFAVRAGLSTAPTLADIAVRSGDDELLGAMVHSYLHTDRADQARALRRSLQHVPAGRLTQSLLPRMDTLANTQIRAAELLAELPIEHAIGSMRSLLRSGAHPRAKLFVAEAMLNAGHRREQLQALVPTAVLQLAEQRRKAASKFRSLEPAAR